MLARFVIWRSEKGLEANIPYGADGKSDKGAHPTGFFVSREDAEFQILLCELRYPPLYIRGGTSRLSDGAGGLQFQRARSKNPGSRWRVKVAKSWPWFGSRTPPLDQ
jgi:hypothetical protein